MRCVLAFVLAVCVVAAASSIVQLTEENYDVTINQSGRDTVVHYTVSNNEQCAQTSASFAQMRDEYQERVIFGAVDCDSQKALCQKNSVTAHPTVHYFFGDSTIGHVFIGQYTTENIKGFLDNNLNNQCAPETRSYCNVNQTETLDAMAGATFEELSTGILEKKQQISDMKANFYNYTQEIRKEYEEIKARVVTFDEVALSQIKVLHILRKGKKAADAKEEL